MLLSRPGMLIYLRAHVCPTCQRSFTQPHHLQSHLNSQQCVLSLLTVYEAANTFACLSLGAKPHECGIGGCTLAFADQGARSKHRKRVHGHTAANAIVKSKRAPVSVAPTTKVVVDVGTQAPEVNLDASSSSGSFKPLKEENEALVISEAIQCLTRRCAPSSDVAVATTSHGDVNPNEPPQLYLPDYISPSPSASSKSKDSNVMQHADAVQPHPPQCSSSAQIMLALHEPASQPKEPIEAHLSQATIPSCPTFGTAFPFSFDYFCRPPVVHNHGDSLYAHQFPYYLGSHRSTDGSNPYSFSWPSPSSANPRKHEHASPSYSYSSTVSSNDLQSHGSGTYNSVVAEPNTVVPRVDYGTTHENAGSQHQHFSYGDTPYPRYEGTLHSIHGIHGQADQQQQHARLDTPRVTYETPSHGNLATVQSQHQLLWDFGSSISSADSSWTTSWSSSASSR